MLNVLFTCLILGGLIWTGWWYAVSIGQERALERWFDQRARAGWQAEHGDIRLTGFPFRLTRMVPEIRLADPAAGWAWAAPFLRIESGPVTPTRFEVTWPERQSFALPGERMEITAESLESQLAVRPEKALGLVRASLTAAGLDVAANSGWRAGAAALEARVARRAEDRGHDLWLDAERVALPGPLMARIDPLGVAAAELERVVLDAAAVFTRPLDRRLIEEGGLGLSEATVRRAHLQWGEIKLELAGEVRVDEAGYPVGELDVTAEHWREIVAMARRSGAIGEDMAGALESGLQLIATLGGDADRLDATLRFRDGQVWLGPVSLGRAPRLAAPGG